MAIIQYMRLFSPLLLLLVVGDAVAGVAVAATGGVGLEGGHGLVEGVVQGHDVQHVLSDFGEVPLGLGPDHVRELVPCVGGDDVALREVVQGVEEELLGGAVLDEVRGGGILRFLL